jgi:hypothetical protein
MNAPGVAVWAGIWIGGIIRSFFFHDNITADSYLEMLQENIVPAIASEMHLDETFYMHGELQLITRDLFDNFWTIRFLIDGSVDVDGLTGQRDPQISHRPIFLWGVIKDRVYATKAQNLQTLKDAIITEMQTLSVKLCRSACQSVPERLRLCKDLEGKHIEQFL